MKLFSSIAQSFSLALSAAALLLGSGMLLAGETLPLEKRLPQEALLEPPNSITFNLFDSDKGTTPIAAQTYFPGEWEVVEAESGRMLWASFDNKSVLDEFPEVWMELEADGVLIGEREPVRAVTLGVTFALGNALNMNGNAISSLAEPLATDTDHAATVNYVNNRVATGNAATATALAADGLDCPLGQYARGVDASGNAQGCAVDEIGVGDNLGNHIATQNIQLGSNWLSGDGGSEGIQVGATGKVGIAILPGSANLQVGGIDGFLVTGTHSTGAIPAQGAGSRLMWYPSKSAFRAGYVDGTQWDNVNIGEYSVGLGYMITASGTDSIAMGHSSTASGPWSTAIGYYTTASSQSAVALGYGTTASSLYTTALGYQTTASADSAMAMGSGTTASHSASTAMGGQTTASAMYSTAMGKETTARSYAETVLGSLNTTYTPTSQLDWIPTDRLFVVGNGDPFIGGFPSDALVMLKNGNTGIGTSYPYVRLHVDDGSDCGPSSGGFIFSGDPTASHICIDDNEILARNPATAPTLFINNEGALTQVGGKLKIIDLASVGATPLCQTGNIVATCSSSSRYKEAIEPLPMGLKTVERLKPVTFKWKERDELDLGFVAEQVAEIDPLLAIYNADGEIQGVKYRQLTAVLVNAVQEQQKRFAEQEEEIASLRSDLQQYRQMAAEVADEKYRHLAAEIAELKRKQANNPQLLTSYRDAKPFR